MKHAGEPRHVRASSQIARPSAMTPDLKSVQNLLYRLIVAPSGVTDGMRVEPDLPVGGLGAIVRGDSRLSAIERLDIYAEMYFYRLLDCLKEDYPATLAVVGATNFHNLITGYLLAYPPSHPSVLYAGRYLPDFLESHPLREQWQFIADLARLERALIEVFHAADAPALSRDELHAIAPGDWPMLELKTHPALQLLPMEWNVANVARAVEDGIEWQTPKRESSHVLVWRKDCRSYYREVGGIERDLIHAMTAGASVAALCEQVAAASLSGDPTVAFLELLERWLADSILTIPLSARAD
jgi:hypothetical protein